MSWRSALPKVIYLNIFETCH